MSVRDRYETPAAFRQALEARLAVSTGGDGDRERLRRNVAFERLLARLFADPVAAAPWVVKGGYALDLRLPDAARRTKDLDLGFPSLGGDADVGAFEDLALGLRRPRDDWFSFRVVKRIPLGAEDDELEVRRFTIEAAVGGRVWTTFLLDLGVEPMGPEDREPFDIPSHLGFAGEPPVRCALATPARHLAEKLHALTRTRGARENSRVKDLIDFVLFHERLTPPVADVRASLRRVFDSRGTHAIPTDWPPLPESWDEPFAAMAAATGTKTRTFAAAVVLARSIWPQYSGEA